MYNEIYKYAVDNKLGSGSDIYFYTQRIQFSIHLSQDGKFINITENVDDQPVSKKDPNGKKRKVIISFTKIPFTSNNKKISPDKGIYSFLHETFDIILDRDKPSYDVRKFKTFISQIEDFKTSTKMDILDPIINFLNSEDETNKCKKYFIEKKLKPSTSWFDFITEDNGRVIQNEHVRNYWIQKNLNDISDNTSNEKYCIVTGQYDKCKMTMEKVEKSGEGRGKSIVSFYEPHTRSFKNKQLENLPVSVECANRIEAGFKDLLNHSIQFCYSKQFDPKKYLFWADEKIDINKPLEEILTLTSDDIKTLLDSIYYNKINTNINDITLYDDDKLKNGYCLTVSYNNKERIAIHNYIYDSLFNIGRNIKNWFDFVNTKSTKFYSIKSIAYSLTDNNSESEKKKLDRICEILLKVILSGEKIPKGLMCEVCDKIIKYKVKGKYSEFENIKYEKQIALIKKYLNQEGYDMETVKENTMYMCGQLQACLEYTIKACMPNVNKNFVESFYSKSCRTPKISFECLLRTFWQRRYTQKLENKSKRYWLENKINELNSKIGNNIPSFTTVTDRSLFNLGYSDQMIEFYTPKPNKDNSEKEEEETT